MYMYTYIKMTLFWLSQLISKEVIAVVDTVAIRGIRYAGVTCFVLKQNSMPNV